jgi:hypothetical protein
VKSYELRGRTWQELGLSLPIFTRNRHFLTACMMQCPLGRGEVAAHPHLGQVVQVLLKRLKQEGALGGRAPRSRRHWRGNARFS